MQQRKNSYIFVKDPCYLSCLIRKTRKFKASEGTPTLSHRSFKIIFITKFAVLLYFHKMP